MTIMMQVLVEFTIAIALLTGGAILVFSSTLFAARRIKAMPKLRLVVSMKRRPFATE